MDLVMITEVMDQITGRAGLIMMAGMITMMVDDSQVPTGEDLIIGKLKTLTSMEGFRFGHVHCVQEKC